MADLPEPTLEELLREPIILKLMERDGYSPDDIRLLARQVTARSNAWTAMSGQSMPYAAAKPACSGLWACR
ncbi:MAG: hypothetical protein ABS58_03565 [Mesorhizobium sp. SCN 65-20]|nr:MAG: hypothetical protein ABS58_03565 [Mesorhizobium sp. SCN 65-20]